MQAGASNPHVDPLEVVASTADPAFATDEEGRVVIWNRAAEKVFGYEAARVLGKPCHQVLCGRDVFGNRFCDESCVLRSMIRHHEALHHFELDLRTARGDTVRVSISIVVIPGPRTSQHTLIHLVQILNPEGVGATEHPRLLAGPSEPTLPRHASPSQSSATAQPGILTTRETEVLRLLADGSSTSVIADSLFISQTTVRNHVQNILRKLEVHSKLEAVSLAFRSRLI